MADGGGAGDQRPVGADRFPAGRELGGAVIKERQTGIITLDGVRWAKPAGGPRGKTPIQRSSQVLSPGDVIYADPLIGKDGNAVEGQYRLRQLPEVSGAMVVMDPWTGRVLAMVGGFSFDQSQFNRATQAYRQPGSSFKPMVYSAALDNGYTPSTVVVDAPIEIDQGQGGGVWRPENYSVGKYLRPDRRCATRLEQSRNTDDGAAGAGHRHAADRRICQALRRLRRICRTICPMRSAPAKPRCMRMVTAYSMFANGGRRVKPTLIDRIQDRYGHTIFKHDAARMPRLRRAGGWKNQPEPQLVDRREQVHRSDDGLPDHLDDGRRGAGRHGDGGARSRQADRRQDRHHQRRKGRLVHRLFAGHRLSASIWATTSRAHLGSGCAPAAISPRRSSRIS